jgi:localization factor PodJL
MKPGIPWSVKGIEPEARVVAKRAARRAGITLGEWLNSVILDQSGNFADTPPGGFTFERDSFVTSSSQTPDAPSPATALPAERRRSAAAERRDDSALRLQDIAQQLADLAQRERQTAVMPEHAQADSSEALARLVERINDNERQTVEALSAVNDRLTMLSQQIGALSRPQASDRSEDGQAGYKTLETAIRNVVEHIEVSEKRTRDSLKSMQDRIAGMAERGSQAPSSEDILRAAPGLAGLENRLAEMLTRIQRSEGLLAERIDAMKASAQQMAAQAQSSAVTAARGELRDLESRVLAALKETQASAAGPAALVADMERLRSDMGNLARRLDEIKTASASERDLQSLRVALEQLSTRVAQGPDLRPLADMDHRLGEINRRLEQAAATSRDMPQFGALEQRIAELEHQLDMTRLTGDDTQSLHNLQGSLAAVSQRLAQTEEQVGRIETMERAIRQLQEGLEQRQGAGPVSDARPSPELGALTEGLRAVRESAAGSERRTQETFRAVHETLAEIVDRISELEASEASHPGHAAMAPSPQPRSPEPRSPDPSPRQAEIRTTPEPTILVPPSPHDGATAASRAEAEAAGADDFIAAARRAAQAAASRPAALRAEYAALSTVAEEKPGFAESLLKRLRRKTGAQPATSPAAVTPAATATVSGRSRRKALIYAGIVLLLAASYFAYQSLTRPQPSPTQSGALEAPRQVSETATSTIIKADPVITGSLPAGTLADIIASPSVNTLENLPEAAGTPALRAAAAAGDARAQFIVAGRYLDGEGVSQDFSKAFYWYQQSAARGLAPAQYRLAMLFELGKGVEADAARALLWYERAATAGNLRAMHNAAVLAAGEAAGKPDYAKAFRWFSAAAERGFRDSQFNLAILYERGLGTQANPSEAYVWYALAGREGDEASSHRAALLAKTIPEKDLKGLNDRVSQWAATASDDSANVLTVIEPAWTGTAGDADADGQKSDELGALHPADAEEVQSLLAGFGLRVGVTENGQPDARTANAIRLYQLRSGLRVTGLLTPDLVSHMRNRRSA